MSKDFLSNSDAILVPWGTRFLAGITAAPSAVGLVAAQCAALQTVFDIYSAAAAVANAPATRTRGTIISRDAARTPFKSMARELARIINAYPATTNTQRADLGLTPRSGSLTPIPAPEEQPKLIAKRVVNRTVQVELSSESGHRKKPANVSSANLFSFVGSAPPADMRQWVFEGSTTRTSFDVEFPSTVPAGAQVFLTAQWKNPRDMTGPLCYPVSTFLAGGVVAGAMGSGQQEMKEAA